MLLINIMLPSIQTVLFTFMLSFRMLGSDKKKSPRKKHVGIHHWKLRNLRMVLKMFLYVGKWEPMHDESYILARYDEVKFLKLKWNWKCNKVQMQLLVKLKEIVHYYYPVNLFVHCAREKRITKKIYMLFAN